MTLKDAAELMQMRRNFKTYYAQERLSRIYSSIHRKRRDLVRGTDTDTAMLVDFMRR